MKPGAFDWETFLIRPAKLAPEGVCMSLALPSGSWVYHARPEMMPHGPIGTGVAPAKTTREAFEFLLTDCDPLYGLNIAYDFGISLREYPDLFPLVFKAFDERRIVDVGLTQQLIDNAHGRMKIIQSTMGYSLASLERRHLKRDRGEQKKAPNAWRLRYRELYNVPLHHWEQDPVDYSIEDSIGALLIGDKQWNSPDRKYMENSPVQAGAAFALHLLMCWGAMTDRPKIDALLKVAEEKYWELSYGLVDKGLVRDDTVRRNQQWTRDTNAAKKYMVEVCREHNLPIKLTDTGFKKYLKYLEDNGVERKDWYKTSPEMVFSAEEMEKYASLDEDACKETGDETLIAYSLRAQLHSVINTHVPDLLNGIDTPIQPRYTTMVETGRTACSKSRADDGKRAKSPTNGFQFQNPKRSFMWIPPGTPREPDGTFKSVPLFPPGVGIRECFKSRDFMLYADNDFSGLELNTGAQVCLHTVKFSYLADAINAGLDAHLKFAAQMMGISYEEAESRKHEKVVKYYRQLAKVANFGFPGGLGARGLVGYARGYGVKITVEEAQKLRDDWLEAFPEWRAYFRWIRDQLELESAEGIFEQLYVGRWRGGCRYTDACNGLFQGLGADVAKLALYEVVKRCYDRTQNSILFGARPVGFIHDEILAEVFEEIAHEQAIEMAEVMVREGNKLLPDVPVKCVPALSKNWCKEAEAIYNREGRLIPFDLAREGKWEAYYDAKQNKRVKWAT